MSNSSSILKHCTLILFVKTLPFTAKYDGQTHEVALFQSDKNKNICEYHNDDSECDNSGHYYGTRDIHEPKWCAKHFYLNVVSNTYSLTK